MSNRYVLSVVPQNPPGWAVKEKGAGSALFTSANKQNSVDWAVNRAKANQPSQVVIHKADGTIETEYTYGNDPHPPRG